LQFHATSPNHDTMAKDFFHNAVERALLKDGWQITHDPLTIEYGDAGFQIDLGAERIIAAEREGQRIAVEIKTFIRRSASHEFHAALGQYLSYHHALKHVDPNRVLYLAIPDDTHQGFFQSRFAQEMILQHNIKLLVYNPSEEVISAWL
jgi:XisH protein